MTKKKYAAWIAINAVVFVVLALIQASLRTGSPAWVFLILFAVKMLASIAIAFCSMAFCNKIIWNLGYLPAALCAVLFCDALADIAAVLILLFGGDLSGQKVMIISLVLTILFLIYGTVNMETIRPKELSYTSEKLKNTYRLVFMADIHYRAAQSEKTVAKALEEVNALQPDLVLLGGDVTDDRTSAEDMHRIYEMLGKIDAPVYYIYGNHDRQGHGDYVGGPKYTPEELEKTITENGIGILRDEVLQWADDLAVLGREDVEQGDSRMPVSELPERPADAYVICVDHSPYQEDDILETGADLQLSGHTHAGQFFPLQYVYRLGVRNIYGSYKSGRTDIYVSAGMGGWYFPLRTAAHCNYEVITLKPEAPEVRG